MASSDTPKRRAASLRAKDGAKDVNEVTHPHATQPSEPEGPPERAGELERTIVSPMPPEGDRVQARSAERPPKQRDDATAWPDTARIERPKRAAPRVTEIYNNEKPDVVGSPERTIVEPLPPQKESVAPVPLPRAVTRANEQRRERARNEARIRVREDRRPSRDEVRESERSERVEQASSAIDRENSRVDTSSRAENTSRVGSPAPSEDAAAPQGPRDDEPNRALVKQNSQIERVTDDTPGRRLRIALGDVWTASALAVKHHANVLRHQGIRPYIEASRPYAQRSMDFMRPYAQRSMAFIRHWALRAKIFAVKGAARVGLVKSRRLEYELEASDLADRDRADAWRRFHDGRKSSSYLQDDESGHPRKPR